jgi:Photosynthetic reaction centre cytochrome C subunit
MKYQTPMRFLVMALIAFVTLFTQEKKAGVAADQEFPNPTNLTVLKAKTGAEVSQIMRAFTAGLGVQCSYCHIQNNFASDNNPKKQVGRQMIKLVQKINADFPGGKMKVSCYTCHRGEAEPKTAPAPRPNS